ncbi:hypothetical protein EYF80_032496 [Liparis tanakae]|uniref:UPAR/Ly6 domain-containing protein n=1 Tax=Liparis tanakae TaxID=230148 RepID=A0A4Z2GUM3_9TELE|nr:hypothetical protein EYF80_032496 [Liparis tanakae]
MMHLYGALILFVTVSAGKTCTQRSPCPSGYDRCATITGKDMVSKTCKNRESCTKAMKCCSTDLCNSAMPTGSSVLLLLAASGIITVFL